MTKAAAEERALLRGIVETIFYSGPTFSAGGFARRMAHS